MGTVAIYHVTLVWNDASGKRNASNRAQERLVRERLAAAGRTVQIVRAPGPSLAAVARRALETRPDAIVAAGGDGTVSAVASAVAGTGVPLGVLPLGTLNHFALDVGIPRQIEPAVDALLAGHVVDVDAAEANGRLFVNNASVGLYPALIDQREALRTDGRLGAWGSFLLAALALFRRLPTLHLTVSAGGATVRRRTTFVAVGNGCYTLDLLAPVLRASVCRGELGIYLARRPGRLALLSIALRALLGRADRARDLEMTVSTEATIDARHRLLEVALDGETVWMAPPIRFATRPRALKVIVPERAP